MLEKHALPHLHKIEAITTHANQCLSQLGQLTPLIPDDHNTESPNTWQDFCQSMHALLDLALDPEVSAEERGYAWSHLQQWRAWGIQRV